MPQPAERYDVAIVGGGIGGLTVAWRLREQRPDLRVALFESANVLGGKIRTKTVEHGDGRFLLETGPDCFLAQKPWARELAEELGLVGELLPINSQRRGVAIRKNGETIDWPSGLSLIAPTELLPFLRTPLISSAGKARMALDLVLPGNRSTADESVASFVRRRLGQEALDWIAEPLMAGIYNADPDQLSLLATFPNLRELEKAHGSLIRGLRAEKTKRGSGGKPPPPFLTLRGGMQELPNALSRSLGELVHTDSPVTSLMRGADGAFRLVADERRPIFASQVVLATPAHAAGALLQPIAQVAAELLSRMRTSSSGTISMAFPERAIAQGPPGYGLVLPAREQRPFNAVTVMSRKFPERTPENWSLLRLFFGGARSPETMNADDGQVAELALLELRLLYGIKEEPEFYAVTRWPAGNPLYGVGHLERVAAIEHALPVGVHLTGGAYRGVGIPDIVRNAGEVAARLVGAIPQSRVEFNESPRMIQEQGVRTL